MIFKKEREHIRANAFGTTINSWQGDCFIEIPQSLRACSNDCEYQAIICEARMMDAQTMSKDVLDLQLKIMEDTEKLMMVWYKDDCINYEVFQALCFLVVSDELVGLDEESLHNCLVLLDMEIEVFLETCYKLKQQYSLLESSNILDLVHTFRRLFLSNPRMALADHYN